MAARMPQPRHGPRGLPHVDAPGRFQHIVFHLADSAPREALARIELELSDLPPSRRQRVKAPRIAALLDAGYGSCRLADPICARIMADSLLFGHGSRYWLRDWVIMPNHVHVLIRQH